MQSRLFPPDDAVECFVDATGRLVVRQGQVRIVVLLNRPQIRQLILQLEAELRHRAKLAPTGGD